MSEVRTLSYEQYRAADGVSKSDLDWIAPPRTPAHFKAREDGLITEEETPAMRFGALLHRCVLEPDTAADAFTVKPDDVDYRTKAGREWRDTQEKPIIAGEEADAINGIIASIRRHPRARLLIHTGESERCLFAEDSEGTLRKARADKLVSGDVLPDLKTCSSADMGELERSIWKYRYHVQAAYYLDLARLCGIDKTHFAFVCAEKAYPYAVAVYALESDAIEIGRRQYQRDLAVYRQCVEKDRWPSFPEAITPIGLPAWAYKMMEI